MGALGIQTGPQACVASALHTESRKLVFFHALLSDVPKEKLVLKDLGVLFCLGQCRGLAVFYLFLLFQF